MINCIIIDDVPAAVDVLVRYVKKVPDLKLLGTFRSPSDALSFLNENFVNCIFLDINMPETNGLQLYEQLEHKPFVIFTTAHSEFAAESYNLDAVDYLLKPVTFARFMKAIDKLKEKIKSQAFTINEQNKVITLKSGALAHRIPVQDILYLKKADNYFEVITTRQKILVRENMKTVFSLLPAQLFVRVHKSYIVNSGQVSAVEKHQLTIGIHKIPIGLSYKILVQELFG